MEYKGYEQEWRIPEKKAVTPEKTQAIGKPAVRSQVKETSTGSSGVSYAGEIPVQPPVVRKSTDDFMLLNQLGS
ncbi:MAG: hypothetical protein AAB462_04240 [Patescibacteria group bacterium]